MDNKEKIVLNAIEDLRPYLHNDGGDMELVEITDDNKVIIKLLGACKSCSVSSVTIKAGLEENLKVLTSRMSDSQLKTFNQSYNEKIKFGKLVYSKKL